MIQKRAQISVIAVAALAVFAVAAVMLLAGGGGPAQAENTATLATDGGGGIDLRPLQQAATPEPCPRKQSPASTPAHVVTSGHYALFDVYWDDVDLVLVNNPCPPTVTYPTDPLDSTIRHTPNVNIGETVFHIPNSFRKTLYDPNAPTSGAGTPTPTPPYAESAYPELWAAERNGDNDGKVWVVPANGGDLRLGFSTDLLGRRDWQDEVQFELQTVRQPGIAPADRGHVFLYTEDDNDSSTDDPVLTWITANVDSNKLEIYPNGYEYRDWFFTRPGTYVLSVRAKGHPGYDLDVAENTVTSEVVQYTFHVGDLTLDEQPFFRVERSVAEDAAADANVGGPVSVGGIGGDTLAYSLSGEGHENFTVSHAATGAQIAVADGANLDYETTSVYNLTLSVSDGKSRTSYADTSIDDRVGVQINVTDVDESFAVTLSVNDATPTVGDQVTFTVALTNPPVPADQLRYRWSELDQGGGNASIQSGSGHPGTRRVTHDAAVTREYQMTFWWVDDQGRIRDSTTSNTVVVTWTPAGS